MKLQFVKRTILFITDLTSAENVVFTNNEEYDINLSIRSGRIYGSPSNLIKVNIILILNYNMLQLLHSIGNSAITYFGTAYVCE